MARGLAEDLQSEQTKSVAAALCGLSSGLSIIVGIAVLVAGNQPATALVYIAVSLYLFHLLPTLVSLAQDVLLDSGRVFLFEFLGWLGVALAIPFMVVFSPAAYAPVLKLAGLYAEQGRFSLAVLLARQAAWMSERSPLLPEYHRLSLKATLMRILFDSGQYKEALALADELVRKTNERWADNPVEQTRTSLLTIQPLAARIMHLSGREQEAKILWAGIDHLGQQESKEKINDLSLACRSSFLAYGAVRLGEFEAAMRYSELAHKCCSLEQMPKALAGCIQEHWALACLELGKLDEAEEHARESQSCWSVFLNGTAARMAECYYVLGRLKLVQGQPAEAQDLLGRAVEIRRRRYGRYHPELAMTLEAYSQCLQSSGKEREAQAVDREIAEIRAARFSPGSR